MSVCPICKRPAQPETRPFCSKHCADVDLGRWFNGRYGVPAEEQDGAAEETLRALSGQLRGKDEASRP